MTLLYSKPAHDRRRLATPAPEESVPHPADPPIYRELLQLWASGGRTLPGRRDPEWSRLTAPPAFASARATRVRAAETTYRTATISPPWPTPPTKPDRT
ncbi:hypothetical protein [Streptomyces sp. NPDC029004]|uniref:hypothetical protein n=1 Tax=Streptomyces sp. NPDC029004 TaxID=3154490 RepID=UPI0033CA12CA